MDISFHVFVCYMFWIYHFMYLYAICFGYIISCICMLYILGTSFHVFVCYMFWVYHFMYLYAICFGYIISCICMLYVLDISFHVFVCYMFWIYHFMYLYAIYFRYIISCICMLYILDKSFHVFVCPNQNSSTLCLMPKVCLVTRMPVHPRHARGILCGHDQNANKMGCLVSKEV